MNLKYLTDLGAFEFNRPIIASYAYIDKLRLFRDIPNVKNLSKLLLVSKDKLLPYYHNYINNISTFNAAISLELASFILTFCQLKKPSKIADLGSGFSSFVFRYYIKMSKVNTQIWSVDDNPFWLNKTAGFLRSYKMSLNHLVSWNNFRKLQLENFDLVLYDLGDLDTRLKFLPLIISMPKKNKFLILDDMHFSLFESKARKIVIEAGFNLYNLRYFTKDSMGRFADLTIRNKKSGHLYY